MSRLLPRGGSGLITDRARRLLAQGDPSREVARSDLTERAHRLLDRAGDVGRPVPATRSPQPAALLPDESLVRVLANCSVFVQPFVMIASRHGDKLTMLRAEKLQGGRGGGNAPAWMPLSSLQLKVGDYPGCPYCRSLFSEPVLWAWLCPLCEGLNCSGLGRDGYYRCACGQVTNGPFVRVKRLPVHGASAPAPSSPRAIFGDDATPSLPAASAPRLTWRR